MPLPTGRDQRRFERFNIAMQVELVCPDGSSHICTTRNISEGGIFVLITDRESPPLGEMVTITKLPDQDIPLELPNDVAIIVHKDDTGLGLAFVDLHLGMELD
jgi:hypothetical protein